MKIYIEKNGEKTLLSGNNNTGPVHSILESLKISLTVSQFNGSALQHV